MLSRKNIKCTSLFISDLGQRDPSVIRARVLENASYTLETVGIVTELDWSDSRTLVTFVLENSRTVNICWGLVKDTDLYSIQGTLNKNAQIQIIRVGDFEKRGTTFTNQGSSLYTKDKSDEGLFVMRTQDIVCSKEMEHLNVIEVEENVMMKGMEESGLGTWFSELKDLDNMTINEQRLSTFNDSSYGNLLSSVIVKSAQKDNPSNLLSPETVTFSALLSTNDMLTPQKLGNGSDTRDMGISNQVHENVNSMEVKLMKLISERLPLMLMDNNIISIRFEAIKNNEAVKAKYAGGIETLFKYKPDMSSVESEVAAIVYELVPLNCKVSITVYGMNICEMIIDIGNGPVGVTINTFTDHLSNTLMGNRQIFKHNVDTFDFNTNTMVDENEALVNDDMTTFDGLDAWDNSDVLHDNGFEEILTTSYESTDELDGDIIF